MKLRQFFENRKNQVEQFAIRENLDAIVFSNELTAYWLGCGRTELVLFDQRSGWLYYDNDVIKNTIASIAARRGKVGFDAGLKAVEILLLDPDRRIQWVSCGTQIARFMRIKDQIEVEALRLAAVTTRRAQLAALNCATSNMTEQDVLNLIQCELSSPEDLIEWAFDPSVATAGRIQHAWPGVTGRQIQPNAPLLADIGVKVMGYCADVSETIWVEPVQSDPRFRSFQSMMEFTRDLLDEMFSMEWVDQPVAKLAEWYKAKIDKSPFLHAPSAVYFGHGLGLRHHESPGIGAGSSDKLEERMVLSIEPWIQDKFSSNYRYELPVVVGDSRITPLE